MDNLTIDNMAGNGAVNSIVEKTLLFDFYGELLNEHQRNVYMDVVFNDLSLSEIAEEYGISRQGVHDLVKRVNKALCGYEDKLHLIEKFMDTKAKVQRINELSEEYIRTGNIQKIHSIQEIATEIIDNY